MSASDLAISVRGISKAYTITKNAERSDTLAEAALHRLRDPFRRAEREMFWALKDVSFDVKKGEVVGIIGRNGAGKSTLLKIMSRITEPTSGAIDLHGRLGSLLEVGTGFHPELTGRENIYLNGQILGMRREEIDRHFDAIVDFAEVNKFLDTPVKRYSSGMYVRLAFAVAAYLNAEILIIDEVLAVGDAAFQKKCLAKMGDAASKEGRTVLFVSHNTAAIAKLCTRCVLLEEGSLTLTGTTTAVITKYLSTGATHTGYRAWDDGVSNNGVDELKIMAVRATNAQHETASCVDAAETFAIEISYRIKTRLKYCRLGFVLSTAAGIPVFEAYDSDDHRFTGAREPGDYVTRCEIPRNLLNPGRYVVSLNAGIPNINNLAFVEGALALEVADGGTYGTSVCMMTDRDGVVRPELRWERRAAHV